MIIIHQVLNVIRRRSFLLRTLVLAALIGFPAQSSHAQTQIQPKNKNNQKTKPQPIPVKPREAIQEFQDGLSETLKKTSAPNKTPRVKSKTNIKVLGLRDLSKDDLVALMGNITDEIVSNTPTTSRADDLAFLMEKTLRKNGYPNATVDWSVAAKQNTITLKVNQGITRHVGDIKVTGIKDEFKPLIVSYFKSEPSEIKILKNEKVPYIAENINTAVSNVSSLLHSEGYWNATIQLTQTKIHHDSGLVDIHVNVSSGPLYLIAPVTFTGKSPLPLAPLKKQLASLVGKPATTNNILEAQTKTIQYFTHSGYTFATVEMDQQLRGSRSHLVFTLTIGEKYRIGKVTVDGLERTNPAVLKRRFDRIIGRLYNPELMALNQKKLISTGAFKSVTIDTQPNLDGTIDLTLHMKEGQAKGISTYLGAGSFEGFIFGMGYHDRNFMGNLYSLALSMEYSGLGLLSRAGITNPMWRGSDRSISLNAFILAHEFEGYYKREAGIGTELLWTINTPYSIRFYGDALITQATADGLPDSAMGYEDYTVLRAGITQKLDFRNSPLSPNKGFHGEFTLEGGLVNGDDPLPYYRAILQTSYRQPISKSQYLVFSAQAGAVFNDDPENFPIDLRFFMGGPNSVRSFPRREMGPTANGKYRGGQAYWATSVEYNRQVAGMLWTNLFVDVGALSELPEEIGNANVNIAVGLGFWLDLPIGPMRAEYGYNLTQDPGEPIGTFHFTIGVSF